jgi:hypothetical protein
MMTPMTVKELIELLAMSPPESRIRVFDAATSQWLDLSGVRVRTEEDEEGELGDTVLCVDC